MDKNAIKKYAVWARRELIERVSQRAMIYGITAKDAGDPNAESVNGHLLSQAEKRQRQALIRNIKTKGYEQVMEEVAYTWFNRFAALRFMEVNGYLPSHIRVFTNDAGEFKPQILAEAIHLELDGLDMNKVYELESANKSEELFKYLLIVQCNALNSILPGMFQRIEDYTELLLPDYLLREGSVIEQMVTTIPEEDWTDQVQIIGWLYQYYNTEPKDKVFADLKKNIKITKENIPAATQLFTPDWIVHYMVENSLGRLWLEGHPNDTLKSEWKYYLDEAEQEPAVQTQLDVIRKEYAALKPEEIRVIDPCMGSGHILCVLFDVLVRIYEDYGYTAREAAVKVVENNLWGLDIDERAAQLSYFAVMMKARQYDRRFFTREVQPHVYAIEESNGITSAPMHDMGLNLSQEEYGLAVKQAMRLVEEMHDAKEYGSIIHITPCDWDLLRRFAVPREEEGQLHLDIHGEIEASAKLQRIINIAEALAQKYYAVVTNPPYMSLGNAAGKLSNYVKENYSTTKTDMFSVLIERCIDFTCMDGITSLITQQSFFFLSGLAAFRMDISNHNTMVNAVHMGLGAFGNDFGTVAFTIAKRKIKEYISPYFFLGEKKQSEEKEELLLSKKAPRYLHRIEEFLVLPNDTFSYTISRKTIELFSMPVLSDSFVSGGRNKTHSDDDYIRLQWEVDATNSKWVHYGKGGEFRRWYGDIYYLVDWSEQARTFYASHGGLCNERFWGKEGITWSFVTSYKPSFRFKPADMIYSSVSPTIFRTNFTNDYYVLGLLNSNVGLHILNIISSTIGTNVGEVLQFPLIRGQEETIQTIVEENIEISRNEWDSYETSWDFSEHPFIVEAKKSRKQGSTLTIREAFHAWEEISEGWFNCLKRNEEKLNRILIHTYGLDEELSYAVDDKDVTVRRADLQRDIRSFISYAVGCMLGRYSLDVPGFAYAGGEWDDSKYMTFPPDKDAIIPICDDEYFEDDIVGRFVRFVEVAFGADGLEENLRFIADALGGKGSSRDVIRNYFINSFYTDHLKMYQKRPIYWLFDSGKKNGFKCLIYMHRYQPDTIARIRTDYVHEQQSRYRTAIADLEQRINGASTSERVKLSKQLGTLQAQAEEVRVYEEKIHHLADQMIKIDLDDGVKRNYEIFKDVLAKIK